MRKRQHAQTMQHATKHACTSRPGRGMPARKPRAAQHTQSDKSSCNSCPESLPPAPTWVSGARALLMPLGKLSPFRKCENALAIGSGSLAMYARHGGASRLALVPLQLCAKWPEKQQNITESLDLFCGLEFNSRKFNLRLKLRLLFKKGGRNRAPGRVGSEKAFVGALI